MQTDYKVQVQRFTEVKQQDGLHTEIYDVGCRRVLFGSANVAQYGKLKTVKHSYDLYDNLNSDSI